MSQTELNAQSMVILNWIRQMDEEDGPTLRAEMTEHGYDGNDEAIGAAIHMAFMAMNALFLPIAPNFLKMAFEDCVEKIDWVGVARQRMAETEDE